MAISVTHATSSSASFCKVQIVAAEIRDKAIAVTMMKMRENGFERVRLTDIAKELSRRPRGL